MSGGQDVAFVDINSGCPDFAIESGDLKADNGLENAVLISLYTDAYVKSEDLPQSVTKNRGWWGDSISDNGGDRIGSTMWTFDRVGKINVETRNGVVDAAKKSLEWLIEDGIASRVFVSGSVIENERIELSIEIYRPEGDNNFFQFIWNGQELKRRG